MKKFNPNKNIIITLVIVIIVVTILSVTAAQRANEGKPNFFQSIVNDSVAMVDKTISAPVRWVRNGVDSVHNLFSTYWVTGALLPTPQSQVTLLIKHEKLFFEIVSSKK